MREIVPKLLQNSIAYNGHITFGSYTIGMNGNYLAFLVRFQRREGSSQWYATLENAHTHELFRFATARELFIYLSKILFEEPASQTDHPDSDVETNE